MRAPRTALCLALALCACTGGDEERGDDALAAGTVAAALEASSDLSRLVVPLEASDNLGPDATLARAEGDVRRRGVRLPRRDP